MIKCNRYTVFILQYYFLYFSCLFFLIFLILYFFPTVFIIDLTLPVCFLMYDLLTEWI